MSWLFIDKTDCVLIKLYLQSQTGLTDVLNLATRAIAYQHLK